MNSGPVSSSPASGPASSSSSGPTIGAPERKYIPYRQGAEEQLKLTVGNRAASPRAPIPAKAPTAPAMSSSVALVESLLAPEPGPERASSPRYCSALRERCVSLGSSDGTVTVTPTTGGSGNGSSTITWQHQDRKKKRPGVGLSLTGISTSTLSTPYKKGHRRSPATAAADWGYGDGKRKWKRSRNPRSSRLLLTSGSGKWKENLDHLLEIQVEAQADAADASAGTAGTAGTNVTTPLLVAQVPQSAPAAAVVPCGVVPSPTRGTSSSGTLHLTPAASTKTGNGKVEEGNKPSLPSKPPLHFRLPLAKRNSNARPGRGHNNDVNRNNKWEEVPGSGSDGRDLGSKESTCWSSSCCPTLPSLPAAHHLPLHSSPASRPRLQLQKACISPRAGENVDDLQQLKGSENGSRGSIVDNSPSIQVHNSIGNGSYHENLELDDDSKDKPQSLSRHQPSRNKGGNQYKEDKLEKDGAVFIPLEKKDPYPQTAVPIGPIPPSSSSPSEPAAHPSSTITRQVQQQHSTRKQTQTQKQMHSYLGRDLRLNLHTNHDHPKFPAPVRFLVSATATDCTEVDVAKETRNWLEQVFKDTVDDTAARERELTHGRGQDHHHSFLLPLPLVSGWLHNPFDPATDHGHQPVNGAEERPRSPRHTQAEQAATAQIKGHQGLAPDKGLNLDETKGSTNDTTAADGLASQTSQTSVPRLNTGADSQTLAERCKLETDMIMDHQHLNHHRQHSSAVPPSPAPSHSSFSIRGKNRVFGKLPFLSRSRKPEGPTRIEIASPISPIQQQTSPTSPTSPVSPASSMGAPLDRSRSRDAKTYAGSGGRGVVPIQDEVPKGAINGADRVSQPHDEPEKGSLTNGILC